jgi:hypothetical protein
MVTYDTTVLTFKDDMERGPAISAWNYFSSRGNQRLRGTRRASKGVWIRASRMLFKNNEQERMQGLPEGILTSLVFEVASDTAHADPVFPVSFEGASCGDNTLIANLEGRLYRYFMADAQLGDVSAGAAFDTLDCSRRYSLEPVLEFREGAVEIEIPEPPVVSPLAAIISVGSVSTTPGAEFLLPITLSYRIPANTAALLLADRTCLWRMTPL